MKKLLVQCLSVSGLCVCAFGQAVRSSADYSITTETLDAGGLNASSANNSLHGSAVGEFGDGASEIVTATNYTDKIAYVGQLSDMLDPITAVSRITHGSAGTYDVYLPVFGTRGVECRQLGNNGHYTLIFTFGNPLTSVGGVSASVTGGGPAPTVSGAIDGTDAHHYNVTLTNVPDAQNTTITLANVSDTDGNLAPTVQVTAGFLIGDTNSSGAVNSADATQVRNKSGTITDGTNFRTDLNADGTINSADATIVRNKSGNGLP